LLAITGPIENVQSSDNTIPQYTAYRERGKTSDVHRIAQGDIPTILLSPPAELPTVPFNLKTTRGRGKGNQVNSVEIYRRLMYGKALDRTGIVEPRAGLSANDSSLLNPRPSPYQGGACGISLILPG